MLTEPFLDQSGHFEIGSRYPGETRNMVNHIFETLEILDKLQIIDILEDYDVPAVALRAQDFPVTEGSRADVPDYTRCNCWVRRMNTSIESPQKAAPILPDERQRERPERP